jgi:MFS family permease
MTTPFLLLSANTDTLSVCKASLLLYGIFKGICDSCIFASVLDVVPARYRASGMGLMICGGFIIGSTSSTILGYIRQSVSLTAGISSLSIFCLLNVIMLFIIIKGFFKRDYVES